MKSPNGMIEWVLLKVIAPQTARLGTGWKTLTGLAVLLLVQGSRMYLAGRPIDPGVLEVVAALLKTLEWSAGALFGVGVFHKVSNSIPPTKA
jgi:hypothetical protein